jgi:bifunctional non-homologous end joining protein LigD
VPRLDFCVIWAYLDGMLLHRRKRFIKPCLPSHAECPPGGPEWIHEIKHDGFRIMASRSGDGVSLLTRNGYDFAERFPLAAAAIAALPAHSFVVDGEMIVTDDTGLAVFDLIRRTNRRSRDAVLVAFDLVELEGKDLRRNPIEDRKRTLTRLVRRPRPGVVLNEHYVGHGEFIFQHACELGCEGIVSKRLGSPYRSGRSPHWLKVKNPAAPAVRREAEEDWKR